MSDETSIEIDSGWMEDVTFNVDTCNSAIQEYIDSRKYEPSSDNKSIMSWIEQSQSEDSKIDIEKQQNGNKYVEHVQQKLPYLSSRLNRLTLKKLSKKKEMYIEITTVPQLN